MFNKSNGTSQILSNLGEFQHYFNRLNTFSTVTKHIGDNDIVKMFFKEGKFKFGVDYYQGYLWFDRNNDAETHFANHVLACVERNEFQEYDPLTITVNQENMYDDNPTMIMDHIMNFIDLYCDYDDNDDEDLDYDLGFSEKKFDFCEEYPGRVLVTIGDDHYTSK